ncbi:DUF6221 family protein [Streptomyces canus]|uniref:DUF6221 family protein n=1 Tax=Streptomyces canus TaxID=58343 RepID=UPI00278A7247|nr:DUF6221 family protein [Streptomyces canus]MDQ0758659.1 hypothetical protein [Streptomyces canus]
MNDLVQFLRDQLDEEQRVAEAAPRGPWAVTDAGSIVDADGGRVVSSVGGALDGRVSRWPEGPVVAHVLAHDPARVLREIDAKRKLLDEFEQADRYSRTTWGQSNADQSRARTLGKVLRLLALPYADRPGYREEWRP